METNVDPSEIKKFEALAHRWWDPNSEFKPLHQINPLRLNFIESIISLNNKDILDVGCGGGILSEGLSKAGARVVGIDMADKALNVAKLHLHESQLDITYEKSSAETSAQNMLVSLMLLPVWKCWNMYQTQLESSAHALN